MVVISSYRTVIDPQPRTRGLHTRAAKYDIKHVEMNALLTTKKGMGGAGGLSLQYTPLPPGIGD